MEAPESFKKLDSLLNTKAKERLEVKDDTTAAIHATVRHFQDSFLKIFYVESKIKNNWIEYQVLLGFPKKEENPNYLSTGLKKLSEFINLLESNLDEFSSIGVEDFDTTRSDYYYSLFYILKDEKKN